MKILTLSSIKILFLLVINQKITYPLIVNILFKPNQSNIRNIL